MTATIAHKPPTLTTVELAMHLRVSPRTIQNYRDEGKIPFIRINARTFRYVLSEVEKAISRK